MEFNNPFYQEEANRLFGEMMETKANPQQLLKYLKIMQRVARGNDEVLIYGIRKFHKIIIEEAERRRLDHLTPEQRKYVEYWEKRPYSKEEHFSGSK